MVLAATDSREGNNALFRITNPKGEYIPFYADNHPSGFIPATDGSDNHDHLPGLIVEIFDKVNS
ncbi:hypothetical protein D3C78_1641660 [compost metagenome]